MIGFGTSHSVALKTGLALLVVALGAACGNGADTPNNPSVNDGGTTGDGGDLDARSSTTPKVVSVSPAAGATGVALNGNVSVTFSQPMDAASLTTATFTLTSAAGVVPGTIVYDNSIAVFWPAAHLASNALFTATITTGAKSASGVALAQTVTSSFTTGTTLAPPNAVNLGTAGSYVILAKSGISTVPGSVITGNLGVSPVAASYITGFSLTADASNVFSTTPQVSGKVYAADYMPPTPANLSTAVGDMETAFTDAAARAPDVTELGAGNIGGKTLIPGVYKWGTGLLIPTDVTLNGSATDVWIFQVAQNLTVSSATNVVLSGGAKPKNVFWQVAGAVDIDTTAHVEGVILSQTAIVLRTGATLNGRLLAQTAVTLAGNTVVEPAQ